MRRRRMGYTIEVHGDRSPPGDRRGHPPSASTEWGTPVITSRTPSSPTNWTMILGVGLLAAAAWMVIK